MKNLQYIFLSLGLFACLDDEFQNNPDPQSDGSYDYTSSSIYFNDRGNQAYQSTNTGTFDLYYGETDTTVYIHPRMGWSYEFNLYNFQPHTLTDGTVVTSFRVQRSSQLINSAYGSDDGNFRIDGTSGMVLENSDGTLIGNYDGLIYDDGELSFEFESVNITTAEYVVTRIEGFPEL